MNKKLKHFIKGLPLVKCFIFKFLHPHIKTKLISDKITHFFSDTDSSLHSFNQIPQIPKLIISLTSFPARMDYIEYTIFSLITQTIRSEKIILWLTVSEFPNRENDLPAALKRYEQFGLEIKFAGENHKSFNKLVFSLENYPDYIIVTADDDVYYAPAWLKTLYNTHIKNPKDIVSNRIRRVSFKKREIDSYNNWKHTVSTSPSLLNFLLGYSGVLYPPHSLYKDVLDKSLFLSLSPHADDIWFYAMALLAGTKIRKPLKLFRTNFPFDYQLEKEWESIPELIKINLEENRNDTQLKAVLSHYSVFRDFYNKFSL